MRTRLVRTVPFGAGWARLPDALESQLVTPLGELPTASVHYHRQGVNAVVLDGITELAVEYHDGTGWVEPPNCRFLSMKGSFDHLEETPTRKYSFVGIGWMLRQAKVWEPTGLPIDADGKVQFNSATAGAVMATLIQNAQGRGWGAGIIIDFNATQDSAGQPWAKVSTIAYDLDLDLEAILANLYQQGVCDYRWEGRTLRVFNPDTAMGRDLTAGANPVRLVVNDGQTSAPEDWTNEDLLTDALVIGEDGKTWKFNNGANTPLGRLEQVITQGGVSDPGTASLLADQELLKGSRTRISYTREFAITPGSAVWPFRDYLPGDWVMAQRGTRFEKLRTHSLSLTINADGVKGHAVLGDRLEDLLTKLAKRTKGITGGASAGGTGARPAPEGPDNRTPSTPTGLVVGVDAYVDDNGLPQGRVDIDWAHDGTATNGTAMGLDGFQVYYRINEVGRPWKRLLATPETEAQFAPLPIYKADGVTPEEYGFKVRAVARDGVKTSEFTPVVAVVMVDDTTPPPVPEFRAEDLTTWLRTVTVNTTGRGANGETMPRDFERFNAYQMDSPTGFPGVLVDSKYGPEPGMVYQSGTMPTETVWFYLTSVDRSGNESDPSTVQSVTPVANVDLKLITDKINGAMLGGDSVDYTKIKAAEEMWTKVLGSHKILAGEIDSNSLRTDEAFIGDLRAGILNVNLATGRRLEFDDVAGLRITGGLFQTQAAANRGIKFSDTLGIRAYDNNGNVTVNISTAGAATFAGTVRSGINESISAVLTEGVWQGRPGVQFNSGNGDTYQPFVVGMSDGRLWTRASASSGDSPAEMVLETGGEWKLGSGAGSIFMGSLGLTLRNNRGSQTLKPTISLNNASIELEAPGGSELILGSETVLNGNGHSLVFESGNTVRLYTTTYRVEGNITNSGNNVVGGSLTVLGSKNFAMPHPHKPDTLLFHGSTESPVSGIEYWGTGTIGTNGAAAITLPDYFEGIAKPEGRTVIVLGNGGTVEWTPITDGAFTVTGQAGTSFSWLVKAERFGGEFAVEQPATTTGEIA